MESKPQAVIDTGPVIHLSEINALYCLRICAKIWMPESVLIEIKRMLRKAQVPENIKAYHLYRKEMLRAVSIAKKFSLHLAESEALAIAVQNKIKIFFTDDLDARIAAQQLKLIPIGTLGIILRAYREKLVTKEVAKKYIENLQEESTLFLTAKLVQIALSAIEEFEQK